MTINRLHTIMPPAPSTEEHVIFFAYLTKFRHLISHNLRCFFVAFWLLCVCVRRCLGMWHEEMVNNRHKSVVRDMKWTSDGTKICIVYEDGAVIVGDVNGNRIWGKELEFQLSLLEWSPDNRFILFVSGDAKVYAYDAMGNRVKKLEVNENVFWEKKKCGNSGHRLNDPHMAT